MALVAVVDTVDGLSEELQQHYVKKDDGKFYLDVSAAGGFSLEDVTKLKSALSKERESVSKFKEQIRAFDGLDAESARKALAQIEEFKNADPTKKIDEIRKAISAEFMEKHAKEVKALAEEVGTVTSQLENELISSAATKAIAEKKGSVDLLLPHVRSKVKMRKSDNRYFVDVVDERGVPRISTKSNSTDPMTIAELVDEMSKSETFAAAFQGAGAAGSGAAGSSGSRGSNALNVAELYKLPPAERLAAARAQGIVKPQPLGA